MKCLKCGTESRPGARNVPAADCPSCGVVYVQSTAGRPRQKTAAMPISALDESTLKRARQRVEMRLRQRSQGRLRDERSALTLERARQLASAAVQKRRAEMLARQGAVKAPAAAASESSTEAKVQTAAIRAGKAPALPQSAAPESAGRAKEATPKQLLPPMAKTASTASVTPRRRPPAADVDPSLSTGQDINAPSPAPLAAGRNMLRRHSHHRDILSAGRDRTERSGGMVRLLPLVAWLILFSGVVGMILSWTTLGSVEAGMHTPMPNGFGALPLALLLGLAYLSTGVLGFAFFWVSSLISRQLKDIRRLLLMQMPGNTRRNQGRKRTPGPDPIH